jgi:cytoplasmic iron level regulating protein YaaA (DUF328/UPF0246 family)
MNAPDFFVLLPPSEGKAEGGQARTKWTPDSGVFGNSLGDYRGMVANRLSAVKGGDAKLLGVKGAHLIRAQEANQSLMGSPTLPAWQRYTGVVWDHLDLASFGAPQRTAILQRIFVPSGLMGIVRADDPVPDYRLKMGARLTPFGLMSTWWRDDLTEALALAAKKKVVVDVLPQEHRSAISFSGLPQHVQVDLVSKKGSVVGGHNAKAAKGLLVRHLFTSGQSLERSVASFDHPEYTATISK